MIAYSTISPRLLKRAYYKALFVGGTGALLILFGALLIPPSLLNWVGFPLFLIALFLIFLGLFPYKKLTSLESTPYKLALTDDTLTLSRKGKEIYIQPLHNIKHIDYVERESLYGILLTLKEPDEKRDLLPFFSKTSFTELSAAADMTDGENHKSEIDE